MRRAKQQLSETEAVALLEAGTSGVLALAGDNGYPYAVPLSYVYYAPERKLYFHCARSGHKLDAIACGDKASFCVISQDQVIPEKFTTLYKSVIVFGRVSVLDEPEKRRAIELLAARYTPDDEPGRLAEIEREYPALCMLALSVEHLTGKEAIELARARINRP